MDETRWERAAAASGLVFVVLLVVASFLPGTGPPKADDSITKVLAYFTAHRGAVLWGGYLGGLALVFALWFLGILRTFLMRFEGGTGRLSAVAFGAGLVTGAMATVGGLTASALAFKVAGSGNHDVARALFDVSSLVGGSASFGIAVWIGATSVVVVRTGALPKWFGQAGLVIALFELVAGMSVAVDSGPLATGGAIGFIGFLLFLLWVLVASVLMMRRLGATRPAAPVATAG